MARQKIDVWPSGYKAVEKRYKTALRVEAKKLGYKFSYDYLWKKEEPFFIKSLVLLSEAVMETTGNPCLKPLISDDVTWDILKSRSNKEETTSLRAWCAFLGPSTQVDWPEEEPKWRGIHFTISSEDEIEGLAAHVVKNLDTKAHAYLDSINYDVDTFFERMVKENTPVNIEDIASRIYRGCSGFDLCIALLCLGRYEEAIGYCDYQISTGYPYFRYGVGSKGDAILIKEYCERMIAGGLARPWDTDDPYWADANIEKEKQTA